MKVLLVSSEIYPFAKTGGLADVAGSLPRALKRLGVDVRLAMPLYTRKIDRCRFNLSSTGVQLEFEMAGKRRVGYVDVADYDSIPVYFIDEREFFDRDNLYGTPEGDYEDNWLRFAFFSKAIIEMLKPLDFIPDVIHINDWQTSLVPVYLKEVYSDDESLSNTKVLLTIHNIAYQGVFGSWVLPQIGLPWSVFHMEALEFYGNVNYLKGGIVYSDAINTVSPTYAKEIQTPEYGYGLEGILRKRSADLYGILNGIDYDAWNPATDQHIFANYSVKNFEDGKRENKKRLLEEQKLPYKPDVPLIGIVSRMAAQKGFDIIKDVLDDIADLELQFVVLGSGDKAYQDMFVDIARRYPDKFAVTIGFDPVLARKIYAASDMFLMPSRYEPCGLGQMIALRYGSIPVVRKTGGLADTIVDYTENPDEGYGFVFEQYEGAALLDAIKRAISTYARRSEWRTIVERGMKLDFSWNASAKKYIELYRKMIVG